MSKLSVEIKPCKKWRRRLSVEQGSTNVAVMLRASGRSCVSLAYDYIAPHQCRVMLCADGTEARFIVGGMHFPMSRADGEKLAEVFGFRVFNG